MPMLFRRKPNQTKAEREAQRRIAELEAKLADQSAELDSCYRTIRVRDAEIDSLASVVARDRERVRAETAIAAKQAAELTGANK